VSELAVSVTDHVATVEFDRPPHNFFDAELIRAIADAYERLDDDAGCRGIVLCSAGRHFCAGANLTTPGTSPLDAARELYAQALRLFSARTPVVAAVQGAAVGGGLGLACSADFRVTVPGARFHANFAQLGFHQGFGLSATLPRLVGAQRAAEMFYTARKVNGEQAVAMGLADRLSEGDDPRPLAIAFAAEIAASAPLAVRSMKETLRGGLAEEVAAATERELSEQARLWATEDCAIGIKANLAREVPEFVGR
jgi:enoyl-CoA hydratase/carnithine racemase